MDPRLREDDSIGVMYPRLREDDGIRVMDPRLREDDGIGVMYPCLREDDGKAPSFLLPPSFLRRQESIPELISTAPK